MTKGHIVQRIGWILAVLMAIGWLASEIPLNNASSDDQPRVQTCWRRTIDGWENSSQWYFCLITRKPAFHPFYFSTILCASAAWIAVCSYLIKSDDTNDPEHRPEDDM
jgi:hypothetical protein